MSEESNDGSKSSPVHRAFLLLIAAAIAAQIFIPLRSPQNEPTKNEESLGPLLKSLQSSSEANEALLVRRGFSAIKAIDTLQNAREHHVDFLSMFIRTSLHDFISKEDIKTLEDSIRNFKETKSAASNSFNRGMLYFFLALAETIWMVEENPIDSNRIADHWLEAQRNLDQAPELGKDLARELANVLRSADTDGDNRLTEPELRQIILDRE